MSNEASSMKSLMYRLVLLAVVIIAVTVLFLFFRSSTVDSSNIELVSTNNKKEVSDKQSLKSNKHSGAAIKINPELRLKIKEKENSESPLEFDVGTVFDALSQVVVDDNGDVVINYYAKDLLESAFKKMTFDLNAQKLEDLRDLIIIGIPGKAGEQTAKIVLDYYNYRLAEENFMASTYGEDMLDAQLNFEQIVAIRRSELGHEVAEKLFGLQEAEAHFTIQSIQLQSDAQLTDEEKEKRQAELQQEFELKQKKYLDQYVH